MKVSFNMPNNDKVITKSIFTELPSIKDKDDVIEVRKVTNKFLNDLSIKFATNSKVKHLFRVNENHSVGSVYLVTSLERGEHDSVESSTGNTGNGVVSPVVGGELVGCDDSLEDTSLIGGVFIS